jgi:hypothetical protein
MRVAREPMRVPAQPMAGTDRHQREAIMRTRIIVGFIAIALVTVGSVFGVRAALHSTHSAAPRVHGTEARQEKAVQTMKIVPATADSHRGSFFVGTGDGGNGSYTK